LASALISAISTVKRGADLGVMAANGLSARKQQSNGNRRIALAKRKIAVQQSGQSRRQKEKLWRGNWGIRPAKRKIVAQQSGIYASQKNNCGAAIRGLRRPKEQSRHGNWGSTLSKIKSDGTAITKALAKTKNI
jgi:hypothetical protein